MIGTEDASSIMYRIMSYPGYRMNDLRKQKAALKTPKLAGSTTEIGAGSGLLEIWT